MKKSLFEQAAQLKLEIASKEAELTLIIPQLLQEMADREADEVKLESGSFIRYFRRKWTYPENILLSEQAIKKMKETAEATGTATYEELPTLKFMSKKYE